MGKGLWMRIHTAGDQFGKSNFEIPFEIVIKCVTSYQTAFT